MRNTLHDTNAFPLPSSEYDRKCGLHTQEGMSLGDYFAGQAIANLAQDFHAHVAAKHAYDIAEAMLKERNNR